MEKDNLQRHSLYKRATKEFNELWKEYIEDLVCFIVQWNFRVKCRYWPSFSLVRPQKEGQYQAIFALFSERDKFSSPIAVHSVRVAKTSLQRRIAEHVVLTTSGCGGGHFLHWCV